MKILSTTAHPICIGDRNQLLLRIETACGLIGWGEAGLSSRELAVAYALNDLAVYLEGRDPMHSAAIWQDLWSRPGLARDRVGLALLSAIDIALHDIRGKALDVPVHQLLGGAVHDRIETFGCVRADNAERLIDLARGALQQGWRALRLGWLTDAPAVFEPREVVGYWPAILSQARLALGREIMLGIDLHHRLSAAETASFMQRCPENTLDFLEEPLRDETPSAYRALRRMVRTPLAIGEEFTSRWQFLPYVEQGLCDFARIDICNVGGFTEAMRIGGWCAAHGIEIMPHNPLGPVCTAASIHMAAALPNHGLLECWETPGDPNAGRQISPVFSQRPALEGACFPVPDAPGLGVEIDERALASAAPFTYAEMPHLRRADGAFTNW